MRKTKLNYALVRAAAALMQAQRLTAVPKNRELLTEAELRTRLVLLSECTDEPQQNQGHHGG